MYTLRLALAGALAALFTVGSVGTAQAYPDPPITVEADTPVTGGETVRFTAKVDSITCDSWTVEFRGQTVTGPAGTTFSGSFSTSIVANEVTSALKATCTYPAGVVSSAVNVTLLPVGYSAPATASGNGSLPDTGGSNLWILVGGGALVLVGGGAVIVSRRRA